VDQAGRRDRYLVHLRHLDRQPEVLPRQVHREPRREVPREDVRESPLEVVRAARAGAEDLEEDLAVHPGLHAQHERFRGVDTRRLHHIEMAQRLLDRLPLFGWARLDVTIPTGPFCSSQRRYTVTSLT
jgi:hypothetical protein